MLLKGKVIWKLVLEMYYIKIWALVEMPERKIDVFHPLITGIA